jgi:hypothetical protein
MAGSSPHMCFRSQISSAALLFAFLAFAVLHSAAREQSSSESAKFDGPAELPRIYLHRSLADTPAPGKTLLVKSGDDLQAALNHASCGDTLRLETGATFTGVFHLPRKSCDGDHWIILRTTGGGPSNCASKQPQPADILNSCFQGINFTHNVVVGSRGLWPKENFLPGSFSDVGFVNFNHGSEGDYHLCRGKKQPAPCKKASPYLRAGSDGKDLGADIDAVEAATSGVRRAPAVTPQMPWA